MECIWSGCPCRIPSSSIRPVATSRMLTSVSTTVPVVVLTPTSTWTTCMSPRYMEHTTYIFPSTSSPSAAAAPGLSRRGEPGSAGFTTHRVSETTAAGSMSCAASPGASFRHRKSKLASSSSSWDPNELLKCSSTHRPADVKQRMCGRPALSVTAASIWKPSSQFSTAIPSTCEPAAGA